MRRQIRQRKEFLYKKQIDNQQILRDDKKVSNWKNCVLYLTLNYEFSENWSQQ